jgi:hypothetical protein
MLGICGVGPRQRDTGHAVRTPGVAGLLSGAAIAALALGSRDAAACSVCGCGDPLAIATEARPESGTLRAAIDFEYLTARARSDDDPRLTESLDQETLRPTLVTGAFGPYAGAFQAFHGDPWNFYLSATFRTHTTNSYDYRFGDAVLWSALGQYRFWERAALVAGLEGRYVRQDRSGGDVQENTCGTVVAATPGLSVGVTDELWIHARVQFPFVTHLFGGQGVGPTWLLTVQQTLVQ